MAEAFPGGLTAPQQWLDGLLPKLPGASVDTIKHEVLTVARAYFAFTTAWRLWCGPILLNSSQDVYALEVADIKATPVIAHRAIVVESGTELWPTDQGSAGPPQRYEQAAEPTTFFCPTQGEIVFLPTLTPGSVRPRISVLASMTPLDLDIPDHLVTLHYDAICCGVLSRLHLVPGLNYKPDVAVRLAKRYSGLCSTARAQADTSYTQRMFTASPFHRFAQGRYRGGRQ